MFLIKASNMCLTPVNVYGHDRHLSMNPWNFSTYPTGWTRHVDCSSRYSPRAGRRQMIRWNFADDYWCQYSFADSSSVLEN